MSELAPHSPELTTPKELNEAIKAARFSVLEVGTALKPLIQDRELQYTGERVYVGWNIDHKQHAGMIENHIGPGKFAVYSDLKSDISEIITPNTISCVVVANMIGEPYTTYNYSGVSGLNAEGDEYQGSSTMEQKKQTLASVYELVKPGGSIVILETISPHEDQVEETIQALEQVGFQAAIKVVPGDTEFEQLYAQYGNLQNDIKSKSYILEAIKA